MKKYIIVSCISLLAVIALMISFVNGSFDSIKNQAVSSFNDLMISGLDKKKEEGSWIITMPDGTSKLVLGAEEKKTTVSLILDIRPFLEAGLDTQKLPSYIAYDLNKNELYITSIYGDENENSDSVAIDNMYNNIITTYRERLGYHHTLDHFSLSLDNGNAFEYAKNINENDKDIVIVLNPSIFEDASLDLQKLDGYNYADVTMNDGTVKKKLLKVFNIEEVTECLMTNQNC